MSFHFEWDEDKAIKNFKKHGVSFEEAITVFNDKFSLTIIDSEHSVNEERFIDIGLSNKNRIIIVVYTERGDRIRIICSRLPTKKEIQDYENEY